MSGTNELFLDPAWATAVAETYGFRSAWIGDGIPVAVIDGTAGRRLVGGAFADMLPLDEPGEVRAVIGALRARYPDYAIKLKTRLSEADAADFTVGKRAIGHRYFAGDGPPRSGFRRNVRRARSAGAGVVEVRDDPGCVDRFYQLHAGLRMHKFGSIPQPKRFFRRLYETFVRAGRGYFLEARIGGVTCASFLILRRGRGLFYKFGASHPDHLDARPNNLLFDHLLAKVEAGEHDFLDLGLTGLSDGYAGLRRFKDDTGAGRYPITVIEDFPPGYDRAPGRKLLGALGERTEKLAQANASLEVVDAVSEDIYHHFV